MALSAHDWHVTLALAQMCLTVALWQLDVWLHQVVGINRMIYVTGRWAVITGILAYVTGIDVLQLPLDNWVLLIHVTLVPMVLVAAVWVEEWRRGD